MNNFPAELDIKHWVLDKTSKGSPLCSRGAASRGDAKSDD